MGKTLFRIRINGAQSGRIGPRRKWDEFLSVVFSSRNSLGLSAKRAFCHIFDPFGDIVLVALAYRHTFASKHNQLLA